jgi:hypothetical protein
MYSVVLHYKFEVCGFNSLAVRKILRRVTKFGLVGLVRTYWVSWEFPGTTSMCSVMLHAKFKFGCGVDPGMCQ